MQNDIALDWPSSTSLYPHLPALLSGSNLSKMWQSCGEKLLFCAPFLLSIIWARTSSVSSEIPRDYFENILTTPEISFAHISNNSSKHNGSVQWTREYRCESGSFVTKQFWLFNGSNGEILGVFVCCRKFALNRPLSYCIGAATIPLEMLHHSSVKKFRSEHQEKEFAVGFTMRTRTEGKWASIEARQLLINGKEAEKCPDGDQNCKLHQFRCKAGFVLCGFQAKIIGGNGNVGGSITSMRFRCCYIFNNAQLTEVRYFWNSSSVDHPKSYYHNGNFGYRENQKASMRVSNGSKNDTSPRDYYFDKSCGATSDYAAYDLPEQPLPTECEKSKVVELTGSLNSSASTWEGIVQSIFKDLDSSPEVGRRRRHAAQFNNETPPETRVNDMEITNFLTNIANLTYVETKGIGPDKNINQTECFVCEPGHTCVVRRTEWKCSGYDISYPAILVTEVLPSGNFNGGVSEDDWVTVVKISNVDQGNTSLSLVECLEGGFIKGHAKQSGGTRRNAELKQGNDLDCAGLSDHRSVAVGFRSSQAKKGEDHVYHPLYQRTPPASSCVESSNTANSNDREVFCPPERAACGFKYSDHTQDGKCTRTFRVKCCYHCVPEERRRAVTTTRNYGDGPEILQFALHDTENATSEETAHILKMFSDWFGNNSVSGFDWTTPQAEGQGKGRRKNYSYECPPGHMCTVQQLIGKCGRYVIPTANYTVERVLLMNSTGAHMLSKAVRSPEGGHPYFIFSYGSYTGGEEELLCPVGSVATGMRVKSEQGLGMTGLEIECSHIMSHSAPASYTTSKTLRAELSTGMGKWGAQSASILTPIRGFYFNWSKGEPWEGFNVSFGPLFKQKDARPDDETKFCPLHHAICGFSYRTDNKSEIIQELKLRCCPHCIPKTKREPLELHNSDHPGVKIGHKLALRVGLVDIKSNENNSSIDFETGSVLQTLFASRFHNSAYWNRANFGRPAYAFVEKPKCRGQDSCEFLQLVVTCGHYKAYTAIVKVTTAQKVTYGPL